MPLPLDQGIYSVNETDGSVAVGWKLNFYSTGTATPRDTYPTEADAIALTNPNTNPVLSDAAGRFPPIWLIDNDYKAVLTDADDVVKVTRDPVSKAAIGGSISGSNMTMATNRMLGRISTGTGAVEELTVAQVLTLLSLYTQAEVDDAIAAAVAGLSATYQPVDADLTAIAALTTTTFGRSLLTTADAAALSALIGVTLTGTMANGVLKFGTTFAIAFRDHTFAMGTNSYDYGNGQTFVASSARSFINGDDSQGDVSLRVTTNGTTTAAVLNTGFSASGTLFTFGVPA